MCHLQGDKMYNVHFLQVNGNYRAYLCEKKRKQHILALHREWIPVFFR